MFTTNQGGLDPQKTTSNQEGYYIFPQLFVGRYDVSVEALRLQEIREPGVVIDAQGKVAVNIELTVGANSEQMTIRIVGRPGGDQLRRRLAVSSMTDRNSKSDPQWEQAIRFT